MNYEKAKKKAKESYEQSLKDIELCNMVAKKINSFLPKGWNCEIELICFNLDVKKGDWKSDKKTDAIEFKTVCKLVENVIGEKLERSAKVDARTDKIEYLKAEKYFYGKNKAWVCVDVMLYYPKNMPDCKITWKWTQKKVAQVSDECLGLT